jgi:hypothetical protein
MDISQYERELAQKNGRGNQLYQAGTRAWGAAEPTPKRQRQYDGRDPQQQRHAPPPQHAPYHSNPFNRPPQAQAPHPAYPPWQQQNQQQHRGPPPNQQRQGPPPYQQQPGQGQYPAPNGHAGYSQQHGYNQQQGVYHQNRQHQQRQQQQSGVYPQQIENPQQQFRSRQPYTAQHHQQQQQQQHANQGVSFQSFNRTAPPGPPPPPPGRVNASVMNSLRSQLASTLRQHKEGRQNKP